MRLLLLPRNVWLACRVVLSILLPIACSSPGGDVGASGSVGGGTAFGSDGGAGRNVNPGASSGSGGAERTGGSSAGGSGGSDAASVAGGGGAPTGMVGTGGRISTGPGGAAGRSAAGSTGGGGGAGGVAATAGGTGGLRIGVDAGVPGLGGGSAPPSKTDSGVVDPGTSGDGDFTITTVTMQADLTDKGAPKGKRFQFVMDSTKSTIFDGKDSGVNASQRHLTRQITVYIPAQYRDGTPAPILVMQDGPASAGGWGDGPPIDAVSRALDNLTISADPARKIPAFIAIGVENGGSDAKGSERGLEYDTLSDRYARFVNQEVLPAVLANATIKAAYPGIAITDDPEGRATYGCSSGAAASFTMAWFRPDLFRRVITYSGTFVAQQNGTQPEAAMYPLGAWEYHSSLALIANAVMPKPLRVHLNVNEMDNGYTAAESGHHNWVLANQRMAAALKAKGYHYRFNFVKALGHCNYNAWRATLADTLVWAWAGYPTN